MKPPLSVARCGRRLVFPSPRVATPASHGVAQPLSGVDEEFGDPQSSIYLPCLATIYARATPGRFRQDGQRPKIAVPDP